MPLNVLNVLTASSNGNMFNNILISNPRAVAYHHRRICFLIPNPDPHIILAKNVLAKIHDVTIF